MQWLLGSDLLRGLDYLRRAAVAPDERMAEAVDWLASRCDVEGRWRLDVRYPGKLPVETDDGDKLPVETDDGEGLPSRWNTLRALRVLNWYSGRLSA